MKLMSSIYSKYVMLCLAGNLCDPNLTYAKVDSGKKYQKIYIDYLDPGCSGNVDEIAEELAEFILKHNNIHFVLNGYSAGGVIALGTASRCPEQIAGLVLSNTGPCSIGHGNAHFAAELMENFNNEVYIKAFLNSCFAHPVPAEMTEGLWNFAKSKEAAVAVAVSDTLRKIDYRKSLENYKNPVLIMHGVLDTRRKLNSVEMMQNCMPQAKTILLKTGHTPMYEDAEEYNRALARFLNNL